MAGIFTSIISGAIPSYKIAEDDLFFAFLDIMPIRPGHTLVVTKHETDKIFDLDATVLSAMLPFAQRIGRAIEQSFDCNRCGITVIGLEVPHAHMHLVPINSAKDLCFTGTREKAHPDELLAAQQAILKRL